MKGRDQVVLPMDRWPEAPSIEPFLVRIPLAPVPASRPRVVTRRRKGGEKFACAVPTDIYDAWKIKAHALLTYEWGKRAPVVVPVLASVSAVFARPPSAPKKYTLRGERYAYPWPWTSGRNPYIGLEDHDNLTKAALDALVAAGVLADDRLVIGEGGVGRKWFAAAEGDAPCVEVRLWPVRFPE